MLLREKREPQSFPNFNALSSPSIFLIELRMRSSTASPSSFFISPETPSFPPRRRRSSSVSFFTSPRPTAFSRSSNSRILRLSASLLHSNLDLSWFAPDPNSPPDDCGGWAVFQPPPAPKANKKGFYFLYFFLMQ